MASEIKVAGYTFRQDSPGEPITYLHPEDPERERVCTTHSGSPHQAIREALEAQHAAPQPDAEPVEGEAWKEGLREMQGRGMDMGGGDEGGIG